MQDAAARADVRLNFILAGARLECVGRRQERRTDRDGSYDKMVVGSDRRSRGCQISPGTFGAAPHVRGTGDAGELLG
jgi:hypothetical protein